MPPVHGAPVHGRYPTGINTGERTLALCSAARETGGRVHSIDFTQFPVAEERIKAARFSEWWYPWQIDDMLFIDTGHTYEHTLADLRKFGSFVRSG